MSEKQEWPVKIIRSQRRRKTVSAELIDGTIHVRAPQHLSDEDLAPMIENLKKRIAHRVQVVPESSEELDKRAQKLNWKYFDGRLQWNAIRYVTNQQKRYGSCTPTTGTIRISDRVATLPDWVKDYVVMHELSHLKEANHSPRFWELVNRYPLTERARGYLMALDLEQMA